MRWFRSPTPTEPLAVTMTGLRLGDRLLVMGWSDPKLVADLALKTGLTGRACAVDEDAATATRGAAAVEKEGALVEGSTAPLTMLPFGSAEFDVVVLSYALARVVPDRRSAVLNEARRVLRIGGRCVTIERAARGGLAALMKGRTASSEDIERALQSVGYRAVRTLAQREGLTFVEGSKRES